MKTSTLLSMTAGLLIATASTILAQDHCYGEWTCDGAGTELNKYALKITQHYVWENPPQEFPPTNGGVLWLVLEEGNFMNQVKAPVLFVQNNCNVAYYQPIARFIKSAANGDTGGVYIHYNGSSDVTGALHIVKEGGNPNGIYIPWSGSKNAISITHDYSGDGINIDHSGSGDGIYINHSGGSSSNGIYVSKTGSTTGAALNISTASGSAEGIYLISGSSADGVYIEKSGTTGEGIDLHSSGTTSALLITKSSSNHAIEIDETGSGDGLNLTSAGAGKAVSITYSGTSDAMVIDDNSEGLLTSAALHILKDHGNSTKDALVIEKDGRLGYGIKVDCNNTTSSGHGGTMAYFHMVDYDNDGVQFDISTVHKAVAFKVTHVTPSGATGPQAKDAAQIWQYGQGAALRLYKDNAEVGWNLDCENHAPGGGGIKVSIDSTENDSDGVKVIQKGLGAAVFAEIKNNNSSKNAIHAVTDGTGKAVYAEGDIESTKRITAKGFSAYYTVNDRTKNDVPCDNLSVCDLFIVKDTNDNTYWVCVKTASGAGKGVELKESFTLSNP
jgi:hypothetical protein